MASVTIIGVYPVEVTKATVLENARLEVGEGRFNLDDVLYELNDDEFAERFKDTYLIEVSVEDADGTFDLHGFTQSVPGRSPDDWQVGYDKKYLDSDGLSICTKLRLAFFFQAPDFNQPLLTPYGAVTLPKPTAIPPRLKDLLRFVPP